MNDERVEKHAEERIRPADSEREKKDAPISLEELALERWEDDGGRAIPRPPSDVPLPDSSSASTGTDARETL